jgi:hypothetical protein
MPYCVYLSLYLFLNNLKKDSQILKNKNIILLLKYLFLRLSYLLLQFKMTLKPILGLQRPFGPPPIGRWSWNLLGTNTLMLDSRGYMMQVLMGGKKMIGIDAVITKDGLSLSSRQQQTSSLVRLQQQNGRHLKINRKSINYTLPRSNSVLMRAVNILLLMKMILLLEVMKTLWSLLKNFMT